MGTKSETRIPNISDVSVIFDQTQQLRSCNSDANSFVELLLC